MMYSLRSSITYSISYEVIKIPVGDSLFTTPGNNRNQWWKRCRCCAIYNPSFAPIKFFGVILYVGTMQ